MPGMILHGGVAAFDLDRFFAHNFVPVGPPSLAAQTKNTKTLDFPFDRRRRQDAQTGSLGRQGASFAPALRQARRRCHLFHSFPISPFSPFTLLSLTSP